MTAGAIQKIKQEILNRFSGEVIFTAEIECAADELPSIKLGLAVKAAVKARANLADANLANADLARADLARANLARANLARADLADANLADANLADANLARADLADANLANANLADANLADANLARANLAGANLADANLADANLADANLANANLARAKNADFAIAQTRILPDGDLIGWKKCMHGVIVKLRIPEAAKRSHAFGRKCRAEYADVIDIIGADVGISQHDGRTEYRIGQRVTPDRFDENWKEECSSGIHFFITRLEAENY